MDTETKSHLRNMAVAVTAGIPILGGPLAVLLDKYLPEYFEKKRERILQELNQELMALEQSGNTLLIENDRFSSVFLKGIKLAMEEHDNEKINSFKNIILNSAIFQSKDFDEESLFLSWVRDLTSDQIRIMKTIKDVFEVYTYEKSNLEVVLKSIFPDTPIDYLTICQRELSIKNLIKFKKGGKTTYDEDSKDEEGRQWALTNLGKRFIAYIEKPKSHNKANPDDAPKARAAD